MDDTLLASVNSGTVSLNSRNESELWGFSRAPSLIWRATLKQGIRNPESGIRNRELELAKLESQNLNY